MKQPPFDNTVQRSTAGRASGIREGRHHKTF